MNLRIVAVLLALAACKRDDGSPAAPPRPATPQAPATPADAAGVAPRVEVELLRTVPVKLAVSSVVANPKISPFDLVDDDLRTAWNSRTRDLVGAWIAFRVPPGTHVSAVKLIVGSLGTGSEGDYFTLNARIKRVAIWHDGVRLREVDLDIASRELQSVPVDAAGGDYKLEVVAIEPGTRTDWREICVSELQLIGTPAPGAKPRTVLPEIAIGSLDGDPIADETVELTPPPSFGSIDAFCAEYAKRPMAVCEEPWLDRCKQPEANTCGKPSTSGVTLPPLPANWKPHWFEAKLGHAKDPTCNLALEAKGRFYVMEDLGWTCGDIVKPVRDKHIVGSETRLEVRIADVFGSPESELVTVMTIASYNKDFVEKLITCTSAPSGIPACASATIGYVEFHDLSTDDGYDQWFEYKWRRDYKVARGVLTIVADFGKPDEGEEDVKVGRHRLRVVE